MMKPWDEGVDHYQFWQVITEDVMVGGQEWQNCTTPLNNWDFGI